jgi:hypothetical protein
MTFVVSSVLAFALARVMFGAFCMVISSDVLSVLLLVVNVPVIMIMTTSASKVLPFFPRSHGIVVQYRRADASEITIDIALPDVSVSLGRSPDAGRTLPQRLGCLRSSKPAK